MATIQFNLRVPEELKSKIDEASAISGRSINAEATYRLEQSFSQTQMPSNDFDIFMNHLSKMVAGMPSNETSDMLAMMVNAWKQGKKD